MDEENISNNDPESQKNQSENTNGINFQNCFVYDKVNNITKCIVDDNCGKLYTNYYTSSLWRHLKKGHRSIYNILMTSKPKRKKVTHRKFNGFLQTRLDLVELIAIYKRPFRIVKDAPMKRILLRAAAAEENYNQFEPNNSATFPLTVDRVVKDLSTATCQIELAIKKELRGKLISIMIDIASKYGRSVLGVSVQFIKDDKIVLRTLRMFQLNDTHTGDRLASILKSIFDDYDININQVYTITTDNGKNLLKAVKNLNTDLQNAQRGADGSVENDNLDDDGDFCDFQELIDSDDEIDNDEFLCSDDEDNINDDNHRRLNAISEVYLKNNNNCNAIENILCGAHSLQLTIQYALDQWNKENDLIKKCRAIMCKLRTQNMRYQIQKRNLPTALLDCDTRWNSFYLMVSFIVIHFKMQNVKIFL